MLVLHDAITTTDQGEVKVTEYDRVYLEYGPNDQTEEVEKTSRGKALKTEKPIVRPKNKVSVHSVEELREQAIAYFQSKFPLPENKPEELTDEEFKKLYSPEYRELEAASYGADLWVKNKLGAQARTPKALDPEVAIERMIKNLRGANPKLSLEKAREKAIKALKEDEEEEQAA